MPTTRNPGMKAFVDFARADFNHHDSLEGLLRQPLSITATMDAAFGNPRRGALVYEHTDGTMRPIVAANILSRNADGDYEVEFFSDVTVGDAVTVYEDDGVTTATGTVATVTYEKENAHTGLIEETANITITWDVAEPTTQDIIVFTAGASEALAGVVVESVLEDEFGLGVEVDGARPEKVAGGHSPYVQGMTGITVRGGLLFIRTV